MTLVSLRKNFEERHFDALKEATKRVGGMGNLAECLGVPKAHIPWWWRRREIPLHRTIDLCVLFPDLFDFHDLFKLPERLEIVKKFEIDTIKATLSGTLDINTLILGDEYSVVPRTHEEKRISKAAAEAVKSGKKGGKKVVEIDGKKTFLGTVAFKETMAKKNEK